MSHLLRTPLRAGRRCVAWINAILLVLSIGCAGLRPSVDTPQRVYRVTLGPLHNSDQWIHDFDLYLVPLDGVRTDSVYAELLIIPKPQLNADRFNLPERHGRLLLCLGSTAKPVEIDTAAFLAHPSTPQVIMLDYITSPKLTATFLEDHPCVIRSIDVVRD